MVGCLVFYVGCFHVGPCCFRVFLNERHPIPVSSEVKLESRKVNQSLVIVLLPVPDRVWKTELDRFTNRTSPNKIPTRNSEYDMRQNSLDIWIRTTHVPL
jgi:hypothetical protein